MSDQKAILTELAQLTMLTGRISETHYKNMSNFPFVFFNEVTKVEIDYDIATNKEDKSLVTYKIDLNLNTNDYLDKRFQALENSIRTLFWKEVGIEVFLNSEEYYKSNKNGE